MAKLQLGAGTLYMGLHWGLSKNSEASRVLTLLILLSYEVYTSIHSLKYVLLSNIL